MEETGACRRQTPTVCTEHETQEPYSRCVQAHLTLGGRQRMTAAAGLRRLDPSAIKFTHQPNSLRNSQTDRQTDIILPAQQHLCESYQGHGPDGLSDFKCILCWKTQRARSAVRRGGKLLNYGRTIESCNTHIQNSQRTGGGATCQT